MAAGRKRVSAGYVCSIEDGEDGERQARAALGLLRSIRSAEAKTGMLTSGERAEIIARR
jgi:hypothetical protein